ncbi:thioredoxin-disulfide reductase [Eubacterium barkeri]|uniref:Thioredoxin reductase n=1 Tax=Eubacterium barkeri TaxID=1528 RepID=A0A1H3J9B8_EUBBA|nr:thioredoxin-disulfide reductase [Eubacterium barkeri]SDY35784.1 thioredoxin reductase (NADPH) [Eubacterium barkeri]
MQYDVIIIGSGPAGLSAGIYAARGQLNTLILEKGAIGGQAVTTWEIENYPGAPEETTGPSLTERMREQCVSFGVTFMTGEYRSLAKTTEGYVVSVGDQSITTQCVIVASGAEPRLLGCPGEQEYRGMGVSYCATCDANFFRNRHVAVVGGGDTAIEEALYLTKFASQVTVIHRRDALRATKILADRAMANNKIDIVWDSIVESIDGDGLVSGVTLKNVNTGESQKLPVDGVFIFVGQKPNSDVFADDLTLDDRGYIITDEQMSVGLPGIFAAGDVRQKMLRQVVTATADGAIAGVSAIRYLENL